MREGRLTVTLTPRAATAVERMRKEFQDEPTTTETIRRGLLLLDLWLSLEEDEEITVRNKITGRMDRVRFVWELR